MDIINNTEVDAVIEEMIGFTPADTVQILLFVNNHDYECTSGIGDLVECSAPGYARKNLTAADWTGSIICNPAGPQADYSYPDQTFTLTGPGAPGQTIYGHAFYSTLRSELKWGDTWATAFVIPAAGGVVVVSPTLRLHYCTG